MKCLRLLVLALILAPALAQAEPRKLFMPPPKNNKICPGFYAQYEKHKSKAISCTRTQAQQDSLVRYFRSQGRPGQAASGNRSNHLKGCACDFRSQLPQGPSFLRFNGRGHTGNHYSHTGR